jgi:3-oxoacyl-[acyl-carrier protein] reductase
VIGLTLLVTGGASGIGRATALAAAAAGWAVAVGTFEGDPYDAEAVAAEIRDAGGEAIVVLANVRDAPELLAAVETTIERFGRLDGVVANAGVLKLAPLDELHDEDWDRILDIDLTGVMRTVRASSPRLTAGGAIVVVSSIAGRPWAGRVTRRTPRRRPGSSASCGVPRSNWPPGASASTRCCRA